VLRLAGERPTALIFVDRYARYSATMYCRCEVESVQLLEDLVQRAGPAYRPIVEPLAEELARREPGASLAGAPAVGNGRGCRRWRRRSGAVRRLGTVEDYRCMPPRRRRRQQETPAAVEASRARDRRRAPESAGEAVPATPRARPSGNQLHGGCWRKSSR
jgi:hypothetical protein